MFSRQILKKYILFLISLFVIALGIAFVKHSGLGVSPISSVANVLSYKFTAISFGTWTFIVNCIFVIFEILLLGKKFPLPQLLQIPLCLASGFFTDIGLLIASLFPADTYPAQIIAVFAGIFILGFGITLSVISNVLLYPGEALVKVVADRYRKNFGTLKIIFDVSCVLTSILLSVIMFDGQIIGTREGTLISMIFTGASVKFFSRLISKPLTNYIKK